MNNYSCGPYGKGIIARAISWCIRKLLEWFDLDFEIECERHDKVWTPEYGGPNTRDDLEFALNVYESADHQGSEHPWVWSLSGFISVRLTAFVYKAELSFKKWKTNK